MERYCFDCGETVDANQVRRSYQTGAAATSLRIWACPKCGEGLGIV